MSARTGDTIRSSRRKLSTFAAMAAGIVLGGAWSLWPHASRGGDEPAPAGAAAQQAPEYVLRGEATLLAERLGRVADRFLPYLEEKQQVRRELEKQQWNSLTLDRDYRDAKLDRELAEIALIEYQQGILKADVESAQGAIEQAKSDIASATERLDRAKQMEKAVLDLPRNTRGDVSTELLMARARETEERAIRRAKNDLALRQTRLDVLQKFEAPKRIKELQSKIEGARANEKLKEAAWDLARQEEKRLEQIVRRPSSAQERALREALDDAFELQDSLAEPVAQEKPLDDKARTDVSKKLEQLREIVDRAEALLILWNAKRLELRYKAHRSGY